MFAEPVTAARKPDAAGRGKFMRIIIDTNVEISPLLAGTSLPAHLLTFSHEERFDLLPSTDELDELILATVIPKSAGA